MMSSEPAWATKQDPNTERGKGIKGEKEGKRKRRCSFSEPDMSYEPTTEIQVASNGMVYHQMVHICFYSHRTNTVTNQCISRFPHGDISTPGIYGRILL